ncbi:MAG: PIN domain-containing protein [Candidatus Woesearchaeota archaeon]
MVEIIVDTNFLTIPGEFGVDIFSEFERLFGKNHQLYIIDKTIDELEKIKESGGKSKVYANVALGLIEKYKIKILPSKGKYVDDAIIVQCKNKSYLVATSDLALIRKLKKINIKIINLRQKKYLVINE